MRDVAALRELIAQHDLSWLLTAEERQLPLEDRPSSTVLREREVAWRADAPARRQRYLASLTPRMRELEEASDRAWEAMLQRSRERDNLARRLEAAEAAEAAARPEIRERSAYGFSPTLVPPSPDVADLLIKSLSARDRVLAERLAQPRAAGRPAPPPSSRSIPLLARFFEWLRRWR